MAGGVGSRFWPASREARPKQFLDILGIGKSLLRLTFERFLKICPAEHIYVVTHQDYKPLVLEHLPELGADQVVCEPARRNTAPCIAYAAMKLLKMDSGANMVVAPSDHVILHEDIFLEALQTAFRFTSENEGLLTLGIRPSRPDTGYGYIQYSKEGASGGVHKVLRFTEKPPLEQAVQFLASGDYLWNAGIFIWKAGTVLQAIHTFAPELYSALHSGYDFLNTPSEHAFINDIYPGLQSISIDYAIMEKSPGVFTIPVDFGWSDLGTWASLHAEAPKDQYGNATQCHSALLYESHNCLVRAPEGKLVVVRGLEGFIIVDEGDVLLIYPKTKEQEIKTVTKYVKENAGDRYL